MIKNELKSLLRDRKNFIYIVVFLIISIILNISLNIEKAIDSYYDKIVYEGIEIANQLRDKENLDVSINKQIDFQVLIRTVNTMDGKPLTDEQKKELEKMKCVQEIKSEEHNGIIEPMTIYHIIVDDWKNCENVRKYLNSEGIMSYVDTIGMNKEIFNNYKMVKIFSNIVKYMLIIITILVLNICCQNIVRNEKENYRLLEILGYTRFNIKSIKFLQLIYLLSIGFVGGYVIYKTLFFIIIESKYQISTLFYKDIIINLIIIIIPIFMNIKTSK